jgi:hypothetical protein
MVWAKAGLHVFFGIALVEPVSWIERQDLDLGSL